MVTLQIHCQKLWSTVSEDALFGTEINYLICLESVQLAGPDIHNRSSPEVLIDKGKYLGELLFSKGLPKLRLILCTYNLGGNV